MPYEPYSPTQEQREGHFGLVWLGAVISLMLLVLSILNLGAKVEAWAGMIVGSYMLTFTVWKKFDDYFKTCAIEGARWTVVIIAVWLVVRALLGIFELAHVFGFAASGAGAPFGTGAVSPLPWIDNAILLASLAALSFHAGFLFTHIRGRS